MRAGLHGIIAPGERETSDVKLKRLLASEGAEVHLSNVEA